MLKKVVLWIVVFLASVILPATSMAGNTSCRTKYPVILAHGMGFRPAALGCIDYWWGVEAPLKYRGARLFITSVNGMDSTDSKARQFKAQFDEILAITGAEKVNIIGHSHGTVYTRYAMANLGIGTHVASHTSICGPHRGSPLAELFLRLPDFFTGTTLDFLSAWLLGDTDPDSVANFSNLTRNYMTTVFNPNTPNTPGVYYQSWAGKGKWGSPSIILIPSWLMMLAMEGSNDGLVAVNSAKWGRFRGVEDGAWYSPGVDHINIIGHMFGVTPGFSAPNFYAGIIRDLKRRGY